jgi:hypothetical protein
LICEIRKEAIMRLHLTGLFIHTAGTYLTTYLTLYKRVEFCEYRLTEKYTHVLMRISIKHINSNGYLPRREVRIERKLLKVGGWKKPISSNKELITVEADIMNSA